jgi:hypothetical protein
MIKLTFQGKSYDVQLLDRTAFHEAFLNALVHRDYSVDGMVSVNFTGDKLIITSPGTFYGGVTSENIAKHEPRHRNKALAKMLMVYHLVDRAGMGVLRMSVSSLRYGRDFPTFSQRGDSIEVSMEARFIRAGVFAIANDGNKVYGITDLLILNSVFEKGYVGVPALTKLLSKVNNNPWESIVASVDSLDCVELCGTKDGLFVRVVPTWNSVLDVQKSFRITAASKKHVELYKFLFRHGKASNADIKSYLGHKHTSQTSVFLRTAAYTRRSGRGPSAVWSLVE